MWNLSSPTGDWTCIPCIARQSLNHWTTKGSPYIWLFAKLSDCFSQWLYRFYTFTSNTQGFRFFLVFYIYIYVYHTNSEVVCHCGFNLHLHFPRDEWCWASLCMYWTSFLEECLFKSFVHLWIGLFGFCCCWVVGLLHIQWILICHQIYDLQISSHILLVVFHSLHSILWFTIF